MQTKALNADVPSVSKVILKATAKTADTYHKVSSYEAKNPKKVVLLYSGGLDTSVMLKWIQDVYQAEVIALTVDIGQLADDLNEIKQKAIKLGAKKAFVIDAKDEFADQYIAKGILANGSYQGNYYMATCLGRPLLAKKAVDIAHQENADCIAHGCTGKGNDQVRIEAGALTLDPAMKILAPVREWQMGRDEEIAYAKENNIPVSHTLEKPYSYDDNMWGISAEGGEIENPSKDIPLEKVLAVCKMPEDASNTAEMATLTFSEGLPVALNGKKKKLSEIILELNKIGAEHGVGITVHVEDRIVGLKIRDVYEAPAAAIIIQAHQYLEKLVTTRDQAQIKHFIDQQWSYLCYGAKWHEPVMSSLNAFAKDFNKRVCGDVKLKLYKGNITIMSMHSPYSLFNANLATFMKNDLFNQNASPGFVELWSLPQKTAAQVGQAAMKGAVQTIL